MWIDDVVTHTTIRSVWGNQIRDRVVATFDTYSERDSHTATLPIGTIATVLSDLTLWQHTGTGATGWRPLYPMVQRTVGAANASIAVGATVTAAAATAPLGYTSAMFAWSGVIDGAAGQRAYDGSVAATCYSRGAIIRAKGQWTFTLGATLPGNALPVTATLTGSCAINPAGDDLTIQIQSLGNAGPANGPLRTYADDTNVLSVVYYP